MKVTASLITWNEEEFLPRCLTFLTSIPEISEICVLDSESTDSTQNILKEWESKCNLKWSSESFSDFSSHRNRCLEMATKEWVLMIDADETFTPQLSYLLNSLDNKTNAVKIGRVTMFPDSRHFINKGDLDPQIRIWRNGFAKFTREIHEMLIDVNARNLHVSDGPDILTTFWSADETIKRVLIKHNVLLKSPKCLTDKSIRWESLNAFENSIKAGITYLYPGVWNDMKIKKNYPIVELDASMYDVTTLADL